MSYHDNAEDEKRWEAAAELYVRLRVNGASREEALQISTSCSYQECIEMIEELKRRGRRWREDLENGLAKTSLQILAIELARRARVPIDPHYIERIPSVIAKKALAKVLYGFYQGDRETVMEVLEELYECGEKPWKC
jgi:hypothetical protein